MENAKDPLGRMNRKKDACVYMCINTVMMCSGVCMKGEYLIKGNVRVYVYVWIMSPLGSITEHRHRLDLCFQVTSWHSVIHGRV